MITSPQYVPHTWRFPNLQILHIIYLATPFFKEMNLL